MTTYRTLAEIRKTKEDQVSQLLKNCNVFFAFSDEQFEENKTPLADGDKYVRLGAGGFLPKSKSKQFLEGFDRIEKEYKKTIKENKQRKALIIDELQNREAFYTGEIDDTLEALGDDFTAEEVQTVYNEQRKRYIK